MSDFTMPEEINKERTQALKELLVARIDALETLTEARFNLSEKALNLEAREIQRRLEFLNGEATRLRDMQATYLPREVYEQNHSAVTKDMDDFKAYKATEQGRSGVIRFIIPFVVSTIISLGFFILTRYAK